MQLVLYLILMKLFFEKYVMKSIIESIIGRKGESKVLRSFKDLRYGDVVEIYDDGDEVNTCIYIYMPLKNIKQILREYDGFVTWNNDVGSISYWPSSNFEQRFPNHKHYWDSVKITRYVTHINEWQSISDGDDIKKLFNKYNIPIKK